MTKKNLPLKTKNKTLQVLKYVLPLFVTECQKAVEIHHEKEVAVRIDETEPTLRAIHESHLPRPPKSVHEPPKQSRNDPTYIECLNHPK